MGFSVTHKDGTTLPLDSRANCSAVVSAKQTKTLLSDDTVTIEVLAVAALDLRIGDTINVFGTTYTLNQLPQAKKTGHDEITYTLIFEGPQYALIDRVFMLPDNTVGDNLMTDLRGAVDILVENANRNNDGKQFTVAECPEGTEYKDICYTDYNCLRALQQLCTDWETEFVLKETDTAIEVHVGTFGDTFSLPFSVGRKGGMYELTRNKPSSDLVTRLYAYGGTDNLTYYRHTRLCLPGKERKQSYIENTSVSAIYGVKEGVKNFDEIYPKRTGKVTALGTTYKTFVDSTIDFNLNEKWANTDEACKEWIALRGIEDTEYNRNVFKESVAGKNTRYLIDGTTAQVHFQTGALAGYDIDIESYDNATKTVKLIPLVDANQYEFPSSTNSVFRIAEGDEYIFVGINLPDKYKTNAEKELEAAAKEHYRTCCKPQAAYTLSLSPVWLQRAVSSSTTAGDYSVFDVGDYVHVEDEPLGISADLRVQSFTRDLLSPYDYKLTIADEVEVKTIARVVGDVQQIRNVIEASQIADPNRQRRAWLTAQEVLNRTFDTEGNYYSDKIAPLSIETSMLAVGARSQQLALSNVLFTPNALSSSAPDPAHLTATQGVLHHYSIDPNGVRSWTMSALDVTGLPSDALYVYARCQRTGAGGVFVVDAGQRIFDADPTYYYFLIGTLSSVDSDSNTRVLSLTYGSTTVNGRYVRTGRIESVDGGTYFDLDAGEIGGNIKFSADNTSAKDVIDSLISSNDTVKGASSAASAANAAANAAKTAASEATAKADSAKLALDNFQAGTRNYVKNAATVKRTITGGTAQKSWEFPLVDGASGMTFAKDSAVFAWVSYFVDGWTEDYAPTTSNANIGKTTGGSNNWDWYYGSAGVASGFVQVNDTTRRYWYKYRTAGYTFLRLFVYTAPDTMTDKSAAIYKPMVSFGSALADWQEAIEDTADSISSALSTANAAKTAASEARTTASVASAAAEAANSTADTAKSTANAAKTVAESTQLSTLSFCKNLVLKCVSRLQAISFSNMTGATKTTTSTGVRFDFGDGNNFAGKQSEFVANSFPLSEDLTGKVCTQVLIASNVKPTGVRVTHWSSGDGHTNQAQCTLYAIDSTHWLCYGVINYGSAVKTAGSIRIPDFFITLPADCTYIEFSELKAAKSSVPTAWSEAPEDTDYLRLSLQEATEAQTSITGGLILSKLIGVKSSAGVVVSGINGTDSAVGNGTPMLWAGATSKDTWNNAAFRVYNSGHTEMSDVSISTAGQSGTVKIGDGAITMAKSGGAVTQLTADTMGNLATAITKAGGGSTTASASSTYSDAGTGGSGKTLNSTTGYSITESRSGSRTVSLFTAAFNGKMTISTSYSKSGDVKTTEFAGTAYGSTTDSGGTIKPVVPPKELETQSASTQSASTQSLAAAQSDNIKQVTTKNISVSDFSSVGIGVSKVLEDGVAISKGSDGAYTIKKGKKYTAECSTSASHTASFTAHFNGDSLVALDKIILSSYRWRSTQTASVSIKCTLSSTEYINKYYADGYMLFQNTGSTDSTRRYAGMSSADATVMQLGSGSSLLKFTADGLMQSLNGGSTFVREPLLFRVTYANNAYSATCINLNKEYSCTKTDTGKFKLLHYLGTSNYMAFAQVVHNSNESDWYDFAKIAGRGSTELTIWLIDRNGSFKNDDCEVAIFRW